MSIGEQLDALWRGIVQLSTPWNYFWMGIFAGCITLMKAHLNHYDLKRAWKASLTAIVGSIGLYIISIVMINPTVKDMTYWRAVALFFLLLILSIISNFAAALILKFYRHPITAFKLSYARLLRKTADHLEETTVEQLATQHEQRALDTIKEIMDEHADKVKLIML